ncbi:MAG: 8-amino-7-oxononanoate synthase [Eubacteriales bacterium]|nr:8-amino-7-oxononanoate synthase [Eubacteriales bacterium]
MQDLYSVKMRASRMVCDKNEHISGAEKIIHENQMNRCVDNLIFRGFHHEKGKADFINIKLQKVNTDEIVYFDALPVTNVEVSNWQEGYETIKQFLKKSGVVKYNEIMDFLPQTMAMRGAMLLDVNSLMRLEPDLNRGIRATNMDQERNSDYVVSNSKNHYEEAIVLATKVANCPGIVGEICISDDPNYITGYFASKELGYIRISKLKEMGSEFGGRIFLFDGSQYDYNEAINYLQNTYVIVKNMKQFDAVENTKSKVDKWKHLQEQLEDLKTNNLYRTMKQFESSQGAHVCYNGRDIVLMASNSYLDITAHAHIKKYTKEIIDRYGYGSGGSRLTTGNTDIHELLEKKIADFKKCESALVFSSGYVANVATISALVSEGDVIFSDVLNHASIIDGCRLSKAKVVLYKHNDMEDFEKKIKETSFHHALAVSDAVFSMDGDILKLNEFVEICERYNIYSMIDEAHATGVIGQTGHGIVEHYNTDKMPDIMMGTLSKAIGGEGGYVTGNRILIEYLKNKARGFIFSTSLSQASMACGIAGIEIIEQEPERVKKLQQNVKYFCACLRHNGLNVDSETAIVPILVHDEKKALKLSEYLLEKGYYISAIRYPTVAKNSARLRVAIMSTHSKKELKEVAGYICEFLGIGEKNG